MRQMWGAYVDGAWSWIGKIVQRIEQIYILDRGNKGLSEQCRINVMTHNSKQPINLEYLYS